MHPMAMEAWAEGVSPASRRPEKTLDVSELVGIFGGNLQIVQMALQRFDLRAFERMREPWERRDFKQVGQLAHQWKGTCSYICAKEAQRAAARLEHSSKALADADGSDFLLAEALSALHDFRSELLATAPAVPRALRELDARGAKPNASSSPLHPTS